MKIYVVSIIEDLPRKHYAVRSEYWYYTNKRAAKQQYNKVCREYNYRHTFHENYRFAKSLLHRVNNFKGYNILEVSLDTIERDELPRHYVDYRG